MHNGVLGRCGRCPLRSGPRHHLTSSEMSAAYVRAPWNHQVPLPLRVLRFDPELTAPLARADHRRGSARHHLPWPHTEQYWLVPSAFPSTGRSHHRLRHPACYDCPTLTPHDLSRRLDIGASLGTPVLRPRSKVVLADILRCGATSSHRSRPGYTPFSPITRS